MDTNQSGQKLNWVQKLISFPKRYQVSFSQTLKSAASISRIVAMYSTFFVLGMLYKLFFKLNGMSSFNLPFSGIDILPLRNSSSSYFYGLSIIELLYGIIITIAFWSLDRFLKSLDPLKPFANLNSKTHIGRVAYMAQAFFVAKFLFKIILMQTPDGFTQQLITERTSFEIFQNTGFLFPFNFLILAYFVSIFSQIFKRGITIHNELEEVI